MAPVLVPENHIHIPFVIRLLAIEHGQFAVLAVGGTGGAAVAGIELLIDLDERLERFAVVARDVGVEFVRQPACRDSPGLVQIGRAHV